MFKLTLIIALIAFGISKYNEKYNCTDDGCPEFHELEVPEPTEDIRGKLDIEQWLESPKIEPEIDLTVDESPGKDVPLQSNSIRNISINNTKLANLIDLQDPVKTGVIFKEIFDKPKSLRGR